MRNFASALALLGLASAELYDPVNSDVTNFSHLNFDKQVTKNRDKAISIVHFYKDSDGKSPAIADEYQKFAAQNMGIFMIGAVNCDAQPKICEKEKVSEMPTVRLYPPFPAPT